MRNVVRSASVPTVQATLLAVALACGLTWDVSAQTTRPTTTPGPMATVDPDLDPDLDLELDRMLANLGAARFSERNAAQAALVEEALRHADWPHAIHEASLSHVDPEVRSRAALVVRELRSRQRLEGSRISIDAENVSIESLLAEMFERLNATASMGEQRVRPTRAAHLDLRFDPFIRDPELRNAQVSLTLDDVSFWEAVTALGEKTGFWPVPNNQGFSFMQSGQTLGNYPRSRSDEATQSAVTIELASVVRSASSHSNFEAGPDGGVRPVQGASQNSTRLVMRVLLEPKVVLGDERPVLVVTDAIDERGQNLADSSPRGYAGAMSYEDWQYQVNTSLVSPPVGEATMLSVLRGYVEMDTVIRDATQSCDITDAAKQLANRFTVMLDEEQPDPDRRPESNVEPGESVEVDVVMEREGWQVRLVEFGTPDMPDHLIRGARNMREAQLRRAGEGAPLPDLVPPQFTATIDYHLPPGESDFNYEVSLRRQFTLLDDDGNAWSLDRVGRVESPNPGVQRVLLIFTDRSRNLALPTRLVWSVPLETQMIRVPFLFENVALPAFE